MRSIAALSTILLLTACSTTVVQDSERVPPQDVSSSSSISSSSKAQSTEYRADMAQSFIAFTGTAPGLSHQGRFNDFLFTFKIDQDSPADFTRARAEIAIQIASMETQIEKLTNHLKSADFFDAALYPEARFVSTGITSLGGDRYAVTGNLTIKDVTEEVSIEATITSQYITLAYDLDRLLFHVGAEGAPDQIVPIEAKIVFAAAS